jgi:hypothetical protein
MISDGSFGLDYLGIYQHVVRVKGFHICLRKVIHQYMYRNMDCLMENDNFNLENDHITKLDTALAKTEF